MAEADILAYLPRVRYLAYRIWLRSPRLFDRADLYSVGCLAVCLLDPEWKPALGGYGTFMRPRVHGAMIDHLRREYGRGVHLRVCQFDPPRTDSCPAGSGGLHRRTEGVPSEDAVPSLEPSPLDRMIEAEMPEINRRTVAKILAFAYPTPRGRDVMKMSFLDGVKLKAIGERFGVNESRASQLRTEAIRHARTHWQTQTEGERRHG